MKKIICRTMKNSLKLLCIVLSLSMILCLNVYADNSDKTIESISFTEKQKDILRAFGCSEKKIETISKEELSALLHSGKVTAPQYLEKYAPKADEINTNSREAWMDEWFKQKGLTEDQVQYICNQGYRYRDIPELNEEALQAILDTYQTRTPQYYSSTPTIIPAIARTKVVYTSPINQYSAFSANEPFPTAAHPAPSGVGINGKFHPWVEIYLNANYYSTCCLTGAQGIFQTTSNLYYDYNIFGEDVGTIGWHEGVDLQHTSNPAHPIYSVTDGVFNGVNSDWGGVCIYDESLLTTSVYEHSLSIEELTIGQHISVGQKIALQGNKGMETGGARHVHFEVHPNDAVTGGTSGTYVAKNKDLTLVSGFPYAFLTWYL